MILWYNENRGIEDMSAIAVETEVSKGVSKRGRPRKNEPVVLINSIQGENNMSETNGVETKRIQRTVFDLAAFDDVKLVKDVPLPAKPKTVPEALELFGNDTERLLKIIYSGMVADVTEAAREVMEGFKVEDDAGEPGEDYTGNFADEEKGKLINAAILQLAKMQAGGNFKDLPKEKKRALKDSATTFLRSNPAMLQSIQG